jgi:hypothetical protein
MEFVETMHEGFVIVIILVCVDKVLHPRHIVPWLSQAGSNSSTHFSRLHERFASLSLL